MKTAQPSTLATTLTYEAGKVQRYHTHPRLARLGQTDADHSWGVAALILQLHPNPSAALLTAAILHDTGERFVGDMPAPVGRDNPALAASHKALEGDLRRAHVYRGDYQLTDDETLWLKLCDRLECIMFASVTVPDLIYSHPWRQLADAVSSVKVSPKPLVPIHDVIVKAVERQGAAETPSAGLYKIGDAA